MLQEESSTLQKESDQKEWYIVEIIGIGIFQIGMRLYLLMKFSFESMKRGGRECYVEVEKCIYQGI